MVGAVTLLVLLAVESPPLLWRDPGRVELVDFTRAPGGAPEPHAPFQFVEEPGGGTQPKIVVRDAWQNLWRVKRGAEARAESFVTRLVGALGYFAEPTWFIAEGRINGVAGREIRSPVVDHGGAFKWVAFELRDPKVKFLPGAGWSWADRNLAGLPEFKGLKILVMLVSNWDNKDSRDERRGSNTSLVEFADRSGAIQAYLVNDWGQTLGAWKPRFGNGSPWNCRVFEAQSREFITGVDGNYLRFGYRGQHTAGFSDDITVEDARWLLEYLGKVTDAQIRTGLLVSGASADEQNCFTRSLRSRIEQLRRYAAPASR